MAPARGAYLGRAKRLTEDDVAQARRLVREGVPKAAIARKLECSRQVLYDALNSSAAYAGVISPRPPTAGGAHEVELPL